jgi:hypothetical protein
MAKENPALVSALTGPVGDIDPSFLKDIDTDRLVGAIFALSAEVWILRDRHARLERLLEKTGAIGKDAIEDMGDASEDSTKLTVEAERFAARILGELVRSKKPHSSVGGARRALRAT